MSGKWEGGSEHPDEDVDETIESSSDEAWDQPSEPDTEAAWNVPSDQANDATNAPTDAPITDSPQAFAELSPELKQAQAEHAWQRHGETEFKEIGIDDAVALEAHIENVRDNPDRSFETRPGVPCYGKRDGEGSAGTIVIDNPMDLKNGGTAFRNDDLEKRMDQLVYTPENDQ